MTDSIQPRARSYFAYEGEALAFENALIQKFDEIQKAVTGQYLNPETTQRFRHRAGWSHPSDSSAPLGQWHTHSVETATALDDILGNDLVAIDRTFATVREAMNRQFAQMLYSTVSEAADQAGNVVDAQAEGSLTSAFMAMMEKVEFVDDRYGNVNLPEIHVSPEVGARMMTALAATPQEFRDRLEALKARKIREALVREAERKAKFVRYG